jgi:BON domain
MGILDIATRPLKLGGQLAGQGFQAVSRLRGGEEQDDRQTPEPQPRQRRSSARPKALDDVTIARKVESELFRSRTVDKGKIDVNVVDGVAYLRGTAKNPQQIKTLETKARAIPEVKDVQNLLHLPKTPAPTRADTPRRQQATRRKASPPAKPRNEPRQLNADKSSPRTGEAPEELAKEGKGRQPAKLGAEGGTDESAAPTPAEAGRFATPEDSGAPKPPTSNEVV